ncbi:MAG: hypothetical protein KC657_30200 [Myxococcales bacterium]|nr:hypothetical protein [Myxococcales bacterium]
MTVRARSRLSASMLLAVGLAWQVTPAFAAESQGAPSMPARPTILEADLGSGVVGVGIERVLTPALSLRATFQLNRPWYAQFWHGDESDVIGFGGEIRPFFFPLGTAGRGLYVSPFGRIVGIRAQDKLPESASGVGWSTGTTVGWGWLFGDGRWLARLGAGAQYWSFEVTDARGRVAGLRGVYPDVDIILGYAF